jgi:hypothetical protein
MAVAFDAISSADTEVTNGTALTHNNMTVGSGSNRALIAVLCFNAAVSDPLTTCTWNGVALTKIGSVSNGLGARVDLYGLIAPASGNHTLQVNWSTSTDAYVGCASFTGVDQTGGATSFAHYNQAGNNSTTALSVAITSAIGNFVVGGLITNNGFSSTGNTLIYYSANLGEGGGGEYAAGAASVNVTATKLFANDDAAANGVDLVAAATGDTPMAQACL